MWQSSTIVYHVYLVADLNVKLLFWIIYKNVPVFDLTVLWEYLGLYIGPSAHPPPLPKKQEEWEKGETLRTANIKQVRLYDFTKENR